MKMLIPVMMSMSSPALAAPTYLACTLDQSSTQLPVDVTVDEDGQRAIITLPTTGRMVTRRAAFSPTEVSIPDDETTWVVNRTNLTFQRIIDIAGKRSAYAGTCAVKPAPAKRAF